MAAQSTTTTTGPTLLDLPLTLLDLPLDLLHRILGSLSPREIVAAVGPACFALYEVASSDELWQLMFNVRFGTVLVCIFGGACPLPPPAVSWRSHYFDLARTWMLRAKAAGRVLFSIHGHVIDATGYLDLHPGLPEFLLSAAGTDATEIFALAGHSQNARRILQVL